MILDDKEKLEAIEKIINEKAEDMDDLPWSKREKTNKLLGGMQCLVHQLDYNHVPFLVTVIFSQDL